MSVHTNHFLSVLRDVTQRADIYDSIIRLVGELSALRRRGGRLFILGVGGGAANAAHAVNDLRKLCSIEAYAPTDGIAELTARANDEGWEYIFDAWLAVSRARARDAILVFSVGGGQPGVSSCVTRAVEYAVTNDLRVLGVVGRDDGAVVTRGHAVVVCGPLGQNNNLLTPVTETMQTAVLHALVSNPTLQVSATKW